MVCVVHEATNAKTPVIWFVLCILEKMQVSQTPNTYLLFSVVSSSHDVVHVHLDNGQFEITKDPCVVFERRLNGLTRPNLSREIKFSGSNGDREKHVYHCLDDHEQDW